MYRNKGSRLFISHNRGPGIVLLSITLSQIKKKRSLYTNESTPGCNWDASLSKKFKITERVSFDFRVDARNVLNNPSFDNPTAVINSGTFGRINDSVTNNARRIQLSGKLSF